MATESIKTTTVSSKGQIVIPEEFRELLNIKKGTNLILIRKDKSIIIKKEKEVLEEDFSDLLKISEESLKTIWDNKEDEVWSSYLKK